LLATKLSLFCTQHVDIMQLIAVALTFVLSWIISCSYIVVGAQIDCFRDASIRPNIERIFNIWGERGVYDSEFVSELLALLSECALYVITDLLLS